MTANGELPEIALSAAWQEQPFAGPLRTVDGREVQVIHRGRWCTELPARATGGAPGR